MKVIAVTVVLLLEEVVVTALSGTCEECKTAYGGATKTTDADKCSALKEYLKCLDKTAKSSAGCPLAQADAVVIENVKEGTVCSGSMLTAVCTCQKVFWAAKGDCAALGDLKTCIELDKTDSKDCEGSATGAQTIERAKKRLDCNIGGSKTTKEPNESSTLKVTTQSSKGVQAWEGRGFLVPLLLSSLLMMLM